MVHSSFLAGLGQEVAIPGNGFDEGVLEVPAGPPAEHVSSLRRRQVLVLDFV